MSKTKADKTHDPQKPSPSAQILSNVEMLVAMCEEQERAVAAASEPTDTTAIEAAVTKSVQAAVDDNLAKVVQTAVSEALADSVKTVLHECFSRFEKRIAKFDDRINQVDDQLNKLDSNVQSVNTRLDSLNEKIDSSPTRNESGISETESQLKPQLDMIGSDLAGVVLKFEDKFASLERTFRDQCETVNGFYAKISAADGLSTEATTSLKADSPKTDNPKADASVEPVAETKEAAPVADDSLSDWERQKQAMLANYGDASKDQSPADGKSEKSAIEASSDPSEKTPTTDADEVESLKQQLNSKLREAEVELSINRARLSQERAAFERNQAELDRRSASLEAKFAAMKGDEDGGDDNSATDYMTRIKRHLGN